MTKKHLAASLFTFSLLRTSHVPLSELEISWYLPNVLPVTVAKKWAPVLAHGLTAFIALQFSFVDDDLIFLLSSSPAASSLRTIRVPSSEITDAVASIWPRFSALEEIEVNGCRNIGMDTLRAISRISTIRSLKALDLFRLVLTDGDFSELLGPERMPLLEHLHLSFFELKDRSNVVSLLRNRRNTLRTIFSRQGYTRSLNDWLKDVYEALPDLEQYISDWRPDLAAESDTALLPFLANVRDNISQHSQTFFIRSKDDITLLARSMPLSERLYLYASNPILDSIDLSIFRCVKELNIVGFPIEKIQGWPLGVVTLIFAFPSSERESLKLKNQQRPWLDSLCQLTTLEVLKLDARKEPIDESIAATIASRLTNLKKLILPKINEDADQPQLHFNNMPFTHRIRSESPCKNASDVYLPSVRFAAGDAIPWGQCSTDQLPNLHILDKLRNPSQGLSGEAYAESVGRFAPQLLSLRDDLALPHEIILKMRRLRKFDYSFPISESSLAQIIGNLPSLIEVRITHLSHEDLLPSFDWLNHPMLQILSLQNVERNAPDPGEPAAIVDINPFKLPSLTTLNLVLDRPVQIIKVSSMPNMLRFSLSAPRNAKPAIELKLSECAEFMVLELARISLTLFEVKHMKKLKYFSLHDCHLPPDDADICLDLGKTIQIGISDSSWNHVAADGERLRNILT